jgi:hypothetical protein
MTRTPQPLKNALIRPTPRPALDPKQKKEMRKIGKRHGRFIGRLEAEKLAAKAQVTALRKAAQGPSPEVRRLVELSQRVEKAATPTERQAESYQLNLAKLSQLNRMSQRRR